MAILEFWLNESEIGAPTKATILVSTEVLDHRGRKNKVIWQHIQWNVPCSSYQPSEAIKNQHVEMNGIGPIDCNDSQPACYKARIKGLFGFYILLVPAFNAGVLLLGPWLRISKSHISLAWNSYGWKKHNINISYKLLEISVSIG